ncbi:hypothetical protein Glove_48g44 [Diversispora epigaea]|uniref:Uncharacterized protein n=1 Tax=Diversispora epigaea TaxID=1348612 RepID=A0A397JE27_9GLOM|nr:hypothetical protein Glove_48g44 [Diversispora epigaea]
MEFTNNECQLEIWLPTSDSDPILGKCLLDLNINKNKPYVNHINVIKYDNRTPKENAAKRIVGDTINHQYVSNVWFNKII